MLHFKHFYIFILIKPHIKICYSFWSSTEGWLLKARQPRWEALSGANILNVWSTHVSPIPAWLSWEPGCPGGSSGTGSLQKKINKNELSPGEHKALLKVWHDVGIKWSPIRNRKCFFFKLDVTHILQHTIWIKQMIQIKSTLNVFEANYQY